MKIDHELCEELHKQYHKAEVKACNKLHKENITQAERGVAVTTYLTCCAFQSLKNLKEGEKVI